MDLALILRTQVIIACLLIAFTVVAASPSAALAATAMAAPLHCNCQPYAHCWINASCSGVITLCICSEPLVSIFDLDVLESTEVSAMPAEWIDAKTGVEESQVTLR